MQTLTALPLALALFSCGKNSYTQKDLEGKWEMADTMVHVQLIFRQDSLWILHPVQKSSFTGEEARILDSLSLMHNHYRYWLNGDTIEYVMNSFPELKLDTPGTFHFYKFTIRKLTDDSLILSEFNWETRLRLVRVE